MRLVTKLNTRFSAYYNAGSAALVLLLIGLSIGLFFFFRTRRHKRLRGLPITRQDAEESIALTHADGNGHADDGDDMRRRDKGKGRQLDDESSKEAIFDVGDSDGDDDDDEYKDRR
jgi:carboxypeptidase D